MPSSDYSSDEWLRRILAYTTLFGFISFVFFYGVAESLPGMINGFHPLQGLNSHRVSIPDFSRYEFMRKLSAEEFPLDDPTRSVIITGDLHGMLKPLHDLLHKYSSTRDILIHVGDIVTRGPHEDSMALLTYLASNNITGVRGNNDQQVVEWRGWLNWIASLPGGKAWLDHLEKIAPSGDADKTKLKDWMENQRKAASKEHKKWWKRIPHKWVLFSDHYKVARDMSATEFQYLLDLPLRLYVPSAHVFIVHAGLLASDPQYPYYDKRQPLARVPKLMATDNDTTSKLKKTKNEVESLRKLQDLSLLTLVPQNLIPWVVLNIRSVENGEVTKKNKQGRPWSDLWNLEMNSCVGYNDELAHGAVDGGISGEKKESEQELPCYPSTVIYGHAAKRGLDVKRWSIGLDSGCVYGKKLSALVIGGPEDKLNQDVEDQLDEDDGSIENHDEEFENDNGVDSSAIKQGASFLFSDNARARIRRVRCQRP